ncbi:MAG: hypothetical protein Q8P67_22255 [archaeon]|nr:hypothetical protein [archaeon]
MVGSYATLRVFVTSYNRTGAEMDERGVAIGVVSKLTALLGIRFEQLERNRWREYPNTNKNSIGSRVDTLVVAFGGGALQLAQIPSAEFVSATNELCCDRLFLTDPSQTWYLRDADGSWNGIESLKSRLRAYRSLKGYRNVVLIGNCLGGTAALLCADVADAVLAFNPQIDPQHHAMFKYRLGARRLPQHVRDGLPEAIKEATRKCPSVYLHCSDNPVERREGAKLACIPNVNITYHPWSRANTNLPGNLKKQNQLIPLLQDVVDSFR